MNTTIQPAPSVWKISATGWIAIAVALFVVGLSFHDGIRYMLAQWELPEYNYGYLIPLLAAFLVWQKKDLLETMPFRGSWAGFGVTLLGILLFAAGALSAVYTVIQYAMVIVITGLILSLVGTRAMRLIWAAPVMLLFMIPLPGFLYQDLSGQLQLLSSQIGVAVIRLFGISVFLEGNVIDLGTFKLQVVEACNGLRYLFPLMTLGFIAAYFFKAALWKRALVFLSTIPITVLMNSFRIGVIGILVEYWGRGQAEGFLHDFEGWIIFMACTAILVLEIYLLARLGGDRRPMQDIFGFDLPAPTPANAEVSVRPWSRPFLASLAALAAVSALTFTAPARTEITVARKEFSGFPTQIGQWQGKSERMEQMYVSALNFDDYIMANYIDPNQKSMVNLYVGYYATQRADKVPHSPRACLPGGGWKVSGLDTVTIPAAGHNGQSMEVIRTIISSREQRQLVYYWFKQRDRAIAAEYLVKWYIFWDALTRSRSDGALVRLITPLLPGEDVADGDRRLTAFLTQMNPLLSEYVPD